MYRYLMTGLLGLLGVVSAAEVQPTTAPPGMSLRLTLTEGIEAPALFVGAHQVEVDEVQGSEGKQWDFEMPEGVLPGPQPVQLRSSGTDPIRLLSWVTVLRKTGLDTTSIVIVPKKKLNSSEIQQQLARVGKTLANPDNRFLSERTFQLIRERIKFVPINVEPLVLDIRGRVDIPGGFLADLKKMSPTQRMDAVRRLPTGGFANITPEQLGEFQKQIERVAGVPEGQQLNFNGYTSKLFPDPIRVSPEQPGVSITYFKETVVPTTWSAGTVSVCTQRPYRVQFGSQNAILFKALYLSELSTDDDFWIDPTGYGIPSQVTVFPQQTQLTTQMQRDILQANVRQLDATGMFRSGHIVDPTGGKDVMVFVIDSDSSVSPPSGQNTGLERHGDAITRIIKTLAPAALVIQRHACTGGICRIEDIVNSLCDAAEAAKNKKVIVNLSLNTPYPSKLLAEAMQQLTNRGGLIIAAHGNNDRCRLKDSVPGSVGADYCNAYPADWAGKPAAGVALPPSLMKPPIWKGRLFSAGAWDLSLGKPAGYNRTVNADHAAPSSVLQPPYRTVAPTLPKIYLPGTFVFDFPGLEEKIYKGTSFAAPTLAGMLATWWSLNSKETVPKFPDYSREEAQPLTYQQITR